MNEQHIFVGVGAFIAGAILGLVVAPDGTSVEDIEAALSDRFAAVEAAASESGTASGAAVEQMIADMGARLTAIEDAIGADGSAQAEMMETLRGEIADQMSALSTQGDALAAEFANLGETLSEQDRAVMAPEPSDAAEEAASEAETAEAATETGTEAGASDNIDGDGGAFVGIGAGETQSFGDGALRVTVSRVDARANAARLSVNGQWLRMGVGDTVSVLGDAGLYCRLTLSGLMERQVSTIAACGDDLPEPEGARPGELLLMADGAIRAFISGVATDGQAARVALNGVGTEVLGLGESVDVEVDGAACTVTLEDIDRAHVALSTSC